MLEKHLNYPFKLDIDTWKRHDLGLFLITDFTFILLHIIFTHTRFISDYAFSLEADRGYSEFFQYIKEYWIAILLVFLAIRARSFLYLSWSFLFFYLFLDDSLEIHENVGAYLSNQLNFIPLFNLRLEDFGEILVSASACLIFGTFIAISYRFGDRIFRQISKTLIKLLLALAFCGILIDIVHVIFNNSFIETLLVIVEDGGELIIMSLIACFTLSLFEHSRYKSY